MGCFDTVMVPCPKCGARSEFQSKGGDCILRTFDLENAPTDVLSDVNRHAPGRCDQCGTLFKVGPGARSIEVASSKACEACGRVVSESEMIQVTSHGVTKLFCDKHEVTILPSGQLEVRDS